MTKQTALTAAREAMDLANARYMTERTPEARQARDEASRALSALTPKPSGFASRVGQRQAAEARALQQRRSR